MCSLSLSFPFIVTPNSRFANFQGKAIVQLMPKAFVSILLTYNNRTRNYSNHLFEYKLNHTRKFAASSLATITQYKFDDSGVAEI